MTSRPLAVLFDLDGTLIDSIELILNSAKHAFVENGRPMPPEQEWLAGVGKPLNAMFGPYASDEADINALMSKYREYQLEHHDRLIHCYDQVVATVGGLRTAGHPLAVVTSKTVWLAKRGLDHVGLGTQFDAIVGCDICERHKPDPEPVRRALDLLKVEAHGAVFVGDSVHDMLAGNSAGVTTIAALWGPFSREVLEDSRPAHYLERISDLPTLLAQVGSGRNTKS